MIPEKSPATGQLVRNLKLSRDVRIGSISRAGEMWIAGADDKILVGDVITLIGRRGDVDEFRERFQSRPSPQRGIVIAGGGETGYHLAQCLTGKRYRVLVIEQDHERVNTLPSRYRM